MSMKFGEVDWNSGDVPDGISRGTRDDFLTLQEGTTTVRVVGNPVQYYKHWVENSAGKKRPFNSPVSDPKLVKELEAAGFKRKVGWMLKVLDRKDGKFKILDIGSQIFSGIKVLVSDPDWGPVTKYDIKIIRGPSGKQPLYSVVAKPKQPLEDSFAPAYKSFNDRVDLAKLAQPANPEVVRDFLGWGDSSSSTTSSAPKEHETSGSESTEDDSSFFDFNS